mmetsp:Transcript_36822/g.113631  ORF Transcript_36822/g.113631 Transcript_36822/m.113631 type:complete len:270 (-) Transcript_36822:448-1257(-)
MRFSGTRNRLITVARQCSGTCSERSVPIAGQKRPTSSSNAMKAPMIGPASSVTIGTHMHAAAPAYTKSSRRYAGRPATSPKSVPPSEHAIMKQAKMRPCGIFTPSFCSAGVHMNTKVYIAPSNSACWRPTRKITGDCTTARAASLIWATTPLDCTPKFSDQLKWMKPVPSTRHKADTSNGATGWPTKSTAHCATKPDAMATMPLKAVICEKVLFSWLGPKPRELCSDTIHDSKDDQRMDVATPPSKRPTIKMVKSGKCFVMQLKVYVMP